MNENEKFSVPLAYYLSRSEIRYKGKQLTNDEVIKLLNEMSIENRQLKSENNELKEENKRLTDKLNNTALELVDKVITMGKAVEISEMCYIDFLKYRKENNKPMELRE